MKIYLKQNIDSNVTPSNIQEVDPSKLYDDLLNDQLLIDNDKDIVRQKSKTNHPFPQNDLSEKLEDKEVMFATLEAIEYIKESYPEEFTEKIQILFDESKSSFQASKKSKNILIGTQILDIDSLLPSNFYLADNMGPSEFTKFSFFHELGHSMEIDNYRAYGRENNVTNNLFYLSVILNNNELLDSLNYHYLKEVDSCFSESNISQC